MKGLAPDFARSGILGRRAAQLVPDLGQQSRRLAASSPARCRVGILGFGTVGVRRRPPAHRPRLAPHPPAHTHLRSPRPREARPAARTARQPLAWTDRFDDLLTSDVDIVVEAVVGAEPAVDYVRAALLAGKSVVTANKQVIAHHGPALLTLAERQGRQLRFEAAVGGAMPIVRALGDGLAGDRVTADRRDPERHQQRRAVADGRDRAARSTRRSPTRARAATRRRIRRPISTASMPPRSWRSSARWRSACASRPAQIETRTTARRAARRLREARASAAARSARSRTPSTTGERSTLTAWVAPTFVPRGVAVRAGRRARRTPRSSPARMPATITLSGAGRRRRRHGGRRSIGDLDRHRARPRRDRAGAGARRTAARSRGLSDHKLAEAV